MSQKQHHIIGTAGHVDHGKTSLVKALTGVDTDRWQEEKDRGLTIDLGFAKLSDSVSIIDVPGHERFVKNMVAGVTAIDLVLLTIAADDGIMPQTREHLAILELLEIQAGIVVLTKTDLVEPEWLDLVEEETRELLQETGLNNAPILRTSIQEKTSIIALKKHIESELQQIKRNSVHGIFWLPVDRVFSMPGFGTIVTGSIVSGTVRTGDTVEILPLNKTARVRTLQHHNEAVATLGQGNRAAINLHGLAKDELQRGDVATIPGFFHATQRANAHFNLLAEAKSLKNNARIRCHIGTAEVLARVKIMDGKEFAAGDAAFVQLHFEKPVACRRLELFVARRFSPMRTIGGGRILETNAKPFRNRDRASTISQLKRIENQQPEEVVEALIFGAPNGQISVSALISQSGLPESTISNILKQLVENQRVQHISKKTVVHVSHFHHLQKEILGILQDFHAKNSFSPGMSKTALVHACASPPSELLIDEVLNALVNENAIRNEKGVLALREFSIQIGADDNAKISQIESMLRESLFAPPGVEAIAEQLNIDPEKVKIYLSISENAGRVIHTGDGIYFHASAITKAKQQLKSYFKSHEFILVSEFKSLIENTSRKFALPLLHYLDKIEFTAREGDKRYPGIEADL